MYKTPKGAALCFRNHRRFLPAARSGKGGMGAMLEKTIQIAVWRKNLKNDCSYKEDNLYFLDNIKPKRS